MKIVLNFYASLQKDVGEQIDRKFHTIEIEEGVRIRQLLERLKVPVDEARLVFLNGVQTNIDDTLKDGDRLSILPAVSGG
jgi:molybdopterin converting factor small subunit